MIAALIIAGLNGAGGPTRVAGPPTELLSIAPAVRPGEYVDAFDLRTQGVEILAVCHVPGKWTVTAGEDSSVTGRLAGEAGYVTVAVDPTASQDLQYVFLVRVRGATTKWQGALPPTFYGSATLITKGRHPTSRVVKLRMADLPRVRAVHCP